MKPDFAKVLASTMKRADEQSYAIKSNMCKVPGTSNRPLFVNQNYPPNVMKYLESIKKYEN